MEAGCKELLEAQLLEFMHKATLIEINQVAGKVGISDRGSKVYIINRIKGALNRNTVQFNKLFKKLWGCSGGWLTMTCTHGIIYGVKVALRSESPRDYIDILRSMTHIPNALICDMAHLVAIQGNKFQDDLSIHFKIVLLTAQLKIVKWLRTEI